MKKRLVVIPQPCAMDWQGMEPDGTGRHCSNCSKIVVDFSRKSTAAILTYLSQPNNERTCGRFRTTQVHRPMRLLTWQAAPKLAMSLAAALTLMHCTPDAPLKPLTDAQVANVRGGLVVQGWVLDGESQQPLAGALIFCATDTLYRTNTAADGSFLLPLPRQLAGSKLIAALSDKPAQARNEGFTMPYEPHFFTADTTDVIVLLRHSRLMLLGESRIEPAENVTPAVADYLR